MCSARCFVLVLFVTVHCGNDVSNVTRYSGFLTAACVRSYARVFVSRRVPPRSYRYYHETIAKGAGMDIEREDVQLQWRIVGGKKVSITEAPYTVLYGMFCGGTLIAPDWVITAAHCKENDGFILAGSTQRSMATRYPVCAHFVHPNWKAENKSHPHDFDYQLLLLETPVPVGPNSRPIAIGNIGDIREGVKVSVSGWGHLKFKDKMQDLLRRVYVPIMSHEICQALPHKNYQNITPRMFCTGYKNGTKDSCQGDSGGPAVSEGRLLGLVSFGVGCAEPDQPGVYADITLVRDWIRSVTALPL